jgi:hypothetical protein
MWKRFRKKLKFLKRNWKKKVRILTAESFALIEYSQMSKEIGQRYIVETRRSIKWLKMVLQFDRKRGLKLRHTYSDAQISGLNNSPKLRAVCTELFYCLSLFIRWILPCSERTIFLITKTADLRDFFCMWIVTPSDSEHTDKDDFVSLHKSIRAKMSDLILAVNDNPPVFWKIEWVKSRYNIWHTIGFSLAGRGAACGHKAIFLRSVNWFLLIHIESFFRSGQYS